MANPKHLKILKQGVEAWNKWRREHRDVIPDLSSADLSSADLSYSNLNVANLSGAKLSDVNFSYSNLSYSNLSYSNFSGAKLRDADLHDADLQFGNLSGADLSGADLTSAMLGYTTFADNDLSEVKGLETVRHDAPSSIGVDTLYKSAGKIPAAFLRGCGIPDDFIAFIPSHFGIQQAIHFYSCFISYSTRDEEFARRL